MNVPFEFEPVELFNEKYFLKFEILFEGFRNKRVRLIDCTNCQLEFITNIRTEFVEPIDMKYELFVENIATTT